MYRYCVEISLQMKNTPSNISVLSILILRTIIAGGKYLAYKKFVATKYAINKHETCGTSPSSGRIY